MKDEFAWLDEPAAEQLDNDLAWLLEEEQAEVKAAEKIVPVAALPAGGIMTLEQARAIVAAAEAREAAELAKITASTKLDAEKLRGSVMFGTVAGRKRIWACDGEYVFFRRPRNERGEVARDANGELHRAITRHEEFIRKGDYVYVETQDDVEICRVNPHSSLYRKGRFLGELDDAALRRGIALAACKRDWPLYVDMLTEVSGRIKSKLHPTLADAVYNEMLQYVEILIAQRGGPSPQECAAGLRMVRQRRGEGEGKLIFLPGGRA